MVNTPFLVWPQPQRQQALGRFQKMFVVLGKQLENQGLSQTAAAKQIEKIGKILQHHPLNEYRLAQSFLSLCRSQPQLRPLVLVADALAKRSKALWISEELAAKARAELSPKQLFDHDRKVLAEETQLWAFDYCFFFEKLLREAHSLEQKQQIIFHVQNDMPALLEDALSESVLIKCVYGFYGADLRRELIGAYYEYKKPFLEIKKDGSLTEAQINTLQTALRGFCLKLIEVSSRYGIESVNNVMHFPYGRGKSLKELKAELSK